MTTMSSKSVPDDIKRRSQYSYKKAKLQEDSSEIVGKKKTISLLKSAISPIVWMIPYVLTGLSPTMGRTWTSLQRMSFGAAAYSMISIPPCIGMLLWKSTLETDSGLIYGTREMMYVIFGMQALLVSASLLLAYGVKVERYFLMLPWFVASILDAAALLTFVVTLIVSRYKLGELLVTWDKLFIAYFMLRTTGTVVSMITVSYYYSFVENTHNKLGKPLKSLVKPVSPPSYKTDATAPPCYETAADTTNQTPNNLSQLSVESLPEMPSHRWLNEVLFYRNMNIRPDMLARQDSESSDGQQSLPTTDYSDNIAVVPDQAQPARITNYEQLRKQLYRLEFQYGNY